MATIDDFISWQLSLNIQWLVGTPNGQAYAQVFGTELNDSAEDFREGIKQRMPNECADDAVPYIAQDRNLIQGITETDDHFRDRLQNVWQVAPAMGQSTGVLLQLYYQGYDGYLISSTGIIQQINSTINESSQYFPYDQIITTYSQQNILLPVDSYMFSMPIRSYITPIPASLWNYSASLSSQTGVQQNNRYIIWFPTAPSSWSSGIPTSSQLNIIQSIISDWGPAAAIFDGIIVGNGAPQIGINWKLGTSTMSGNYSSYLSNVY